MPPQTLIKNLSQILPDQPPSPTRNQPSAPLRPKACCADCRCRPIYGLFALCLVCLRRQKYARLNPEQQRSRRAEFVPPRYVDADLDDLSGAVRERLEGFENLTGLYLWGDVRLGKTHILAALANHLVAAGRLIKWISFGDFLAAVRATYHENALRTEQTLMDAVMSAEYLFIDDLGAECPSDKPASDFACQSLFRILNARGNAEIPTYISSNKPISAIGQNYDPRIEYRLREYAELPVSGTPRRREGDIGR